MVITDMSDVNTVNALAALLSPRDETLLRQRLKPSEFRSLQRERAAIAILYVERISQSLLSVSELAGRGWDAAASEERQHLGELSSRAIQLRAAMLRLKWQLRLEWLFPGRKLTCPDLSATRTLMQGQRTAS